MAESRIDVQMRLLAGQTMYVEEIPIEPFSLGEITRIGYSVFQRRINVLLLTLDDMINAIDDFELNATLKANKHEYKVFDMYVVSPEMVSVLIESLSMIFRTENIRVEGEDVVEIRLLVDDKYVINRDNFDEVVKVIEVQNSPNPSREQDDYNPANDVAKSIADKIRRGKEKAEASKSSSPGDDGIDLVDMISAVSAKSNSINKLNIWELTLYQLYDEFARLNKIDNYSLQIQASMWSSDVEIEHWTEPL